ncbi:hypothetical protein LWI28_002049 [Acer negundo]|uniref:RNase H type-1 domain-containing protein n=1 Tax=Acer negundo TaxID=4023 RepID=A0AAD5II33_ACENE|nr:hypothetical protein LWI28_002049 [Acer negundo]
MPFLELIMSCSSSFQQADMELICICFWRVWWLRNQAVHNASGYNDMDVVGWSRNFMDGFRDANSLPASDHVRQLMPTVKCCKPGRGCFQANTDVAVDKNNCCIQTGCIIRDCKGVVRQCFTHNFLTNYSPQATEAQALLCGIKGAVDASLVPVEVKFDAKVVMDMVNLGVVHWEHYC